MQSAKVRPTSGRIFLSIYPDGYGRMRALVLEPLAYFMLFHFLKTYAIFAKFQFFNFRFIFGLVVTFRGENYVEVGN